MKKIILPLMMMIGCSTACAETPEAAASATANTTKPLLWKVSDANNSVYLLGSFHMLKETDYPMAKGTDLAFDDAEQVVFELSPEEMNDPALGQKMAQAGTRTDGKTLQQSISAETWKKFEAYGARNNLPIANFQNFEPWFVGLVLTMIEMQKLGLNPALGLDKHFMDRAAKAGKPAKGLETADSQIALFDGMNAKQQEQFLDEALTDPAELKKAMEELHRIWRNADDKTLFNKMALEMRKEYPELYENMNPARNKAWLPKLEAMLKDNDKDEVLVVVGALHLVGEDGVVKMLADKGYKVERIEK